jgi:hypothetical protein
MITVADYEAETGKPLTDEALVWVRAKEIWPTKWMTMAYALAKLNMTLPHQYWVSPVVSPYPPTDKEIAMPHSQWPTPEDYEARTGKPPAPDMACYLLQNCVETDSPQWVAMPYGAAVAKAGRSGYPIIIACSDSPPPPSGWEPKGDSDERL